MVGVTAPMFGSKAIGWNHLMPPLPGFPVIGSCGTAAISGSRAIGKDKTNLSYVGLADENPAWSHAGFSQMGRARLDPGVASENRRDALRAITFKSARAAPFGRFAPRSSCDT